MAAKTHGTVPSDKQRTTIETDANGTVKKVVLYALWASYAASVPAHGSVDPDNSNFFLTKSTVERQGAEAQITLYYGTLTDSGGGLPATNYVELSSTREEPIQTHPDFSSWAAEWDSEKERFLATSSKAGIESYLVGSTQVVKTEYFSSLPSSDKESIGTRVAPGGGYGSDADNWLLIASNRRREGYYFVRENTYLYSAKAWNEDVYS